MLEKPIHYPDTLAVDFVINDQADASLLNSPYHFIKVDSVDGMWGADISSEAYPIPGAHGERSGDTFRRGKTITFSGTITARGLSELRRAEYYLNWMLWDVSDQRKLIYQTWYDDFQIYLWAKPIQDLAIVERIDSYSIKASYTFALRADEPYTYKLSDDSLYPNWKV